MQSILQTSLIHACENNNIILVASIILYCKKHDDIFLRWQQAMIKACVYNHIELLKLIDSYVDTMDDCMKNDIRGTVLVIASKKGFIEIVRIMTSHNLPVYELDYAFKVACEKGHMCVIKYLFNECGYTDWKKGIWHSFLCKNIEILQYLIDTANKTATYVHWTGYLDTAFYYHNYKAVKLLLELNLIKCPIFITREQCVALLNIGTDEKYIRDSPNGRVVVANRDVKVQQTSQLLHDILETECSAMYEKKIIKYIICPYISY